MHPSLRGVVRFKRFHISKTPSATPGAPRALSFRITCDYFYDYGHRCYFPQGPQLPQEALSPGPAKLVPNWLSRRNQLLTFLGPQMLRTRAYAPTFSLRGKYALVANSPGLRQSLGSPGLKGKTSVTKRFWRKSSEANYQGKKHKGTGGFLNSSQEAKIWSPASGCL